MCPLTPDIFTWTMDQKSCPKYISELPCHHYSDTKGMKRVLCLMVLFLTKMECLCAFEQSACSAVQCSPTTTTNSMRQWPPPSSQRWKVMVNMTAHNSHIILQWRFNSLPLESKNGLCLNCHGWVHEIMLVSSKLFHLLIKPDYRIHYSR